MRCLACALLALAGAALFACIDPGGAWTGGDNGGGGSLSLPSDLDEDGGTEGGALASVGEGTVNGSGVQACDVFTYACPAGTACAFYGAIDPSYSGLVCGPANPCSIVTCPSPKRCVVGVGSPPSLSCQ